MIPLRLIKWYSENNHFKDMNRIDGMLTEFEWKIFPGFMTLGLFEIQSLIRDPQCKLEESMYIDIVWGQQGNEEMCIANSIIVSANQLSVHEAVTD